MLLGIQYEAALITIGESRTGQQRSVTMCLRAAGAAVLGSSIARVRVREYTVAVALHTTVACFAFIQFDKAPAAAAPNTLVVVLASLVAVFSTYTTERRRRRRGF